MEGRAPVVHVCTPPLQTSIRVSKNLGLVTLLTSDKPLPQAEDDTNHRKANTAVNPRSLLSSKKYMSLQNPQGDPTEMFSAENRAVSSCLETTPSPVFHFHVSVKSSNLRVDISLSLLSCITKVNNYKS